MAIKTDIEWCDSTLNLQMGCDGCELRNLAAGVNLCYAGQITDRYGGKNAGFPVRFEEPVLYLERLDAALRWPDLTGKVRPDKPWLDGRPRMIFLNDMGDTFTESLPLDWLAPLLPRLGASPHHFMLLTKRAKRMRDFATAHPLPPNVWPGVSVTCKRNEGRIVDLLSIETGGPHWISAEPLLGPLDLSPWMFSGDGFVSTLYDGPVHREDGGIALKLIIGGGESGLNARPMHPQWVRDVRDQCVDAGVPFFFKQWGEWIRRDLWPHPADRIVYRHVHGGDEAGKEDDPYVYLRVGKKAAGRLLDGREWNEFPEVACLAT